MQTSTATFTKTIEMQFAKVGKRTKLAGFVGQITDEAGVVLHSQVYATKDDAQVALDNLVRELLIDYADRGLVDTVPEAPVADVNWGSAPVAEQKLAQALANTLQTPISIVRQNGAYLLQDDEDLSIYFADVNPAQIVATFQPEPPHAVTLSSILIDQALQRNRLCPNCGGAHWGWQCPEIAAKLFAPAKPEPWKDIALGRELCRMRWRDFKAFVALLLSVPTEHLPIYANSYVAFMQSYGSTDLTINDVLKVWGRIMSDDGSRGPAEMAMQAAA